MNKQTNTCKKKKRSTARERTVGAQKTKSVTLFTQKYEPAVLFHNLGAFAPIIKKSTCMDYIHE